MIAAGSFARPATYANLTPGAISTEVASTGTRSWKLTSTGAFQGLALTRDAVGKLTRPETQPARTFRWEAKLRKAAGNTGGGTVTFGIDTYTESVSSLGQPGLASVSMDSLSSSAWTTVTGTGTTPANTCFVELRLAMASSIPAGDALFIDDVILEDVTRLSDVQPLPPMTANIIAGGSFARTDSYANLTPGAISTEVAATGTRSWKLTSTGSFQGLVLTRDATGRLVRIETQPGRIFQWEAKLRKPDGNTGGGTFTLGIDTYTQALSSLGQPGVVSVSMDSLSSSAWTTIRGIGTTPADTCFMELRLSMASTVPLGDALFIDDVILEDVSSNVLAEIDQPHDLAVGENTFARRLIDTPSCTLTNGQLRLTYFTARKTETVTQIRALVGTASVGATLARVGIYQESANGDITLIASTASDTALFASTGTVTKALSASWSKTRGVRYAVGLLSVGTSTAPTFHGISTGLLTEMNLAPRVSGLLSSQTDLPATVSDASVSGSALQYYVALAP
jgi:hypothetical protein